MGSFFALSLGMSIAIAVLLFFHRKCDRWLDSSRWSLLLGALTAGMLISLLYAPGLRGRGTPLDGLLPVGFSPSLRSPLREVAAAWRPGPLEIMTWVWLAGFVFCLLWQAAAIVRVHWRVRRESRPAGEAIQKALARVSRAMDGGVLDGYAADSLPSREVRVLPGLPGPMSVVVGPKKLLLDREDYDDETLDAILRHELVHIHGRTVSGSRAFLVVVCAAYWFNPLVWLLRREMRAREEYTCDREANLGRTPEERRAYAHAMASLAAKGRREWPGTAGMALRPKHAAPPRGGALPRGKAAPTLAKAAECRASVRRVDRVGAGRDGAVQLSGALHIERRKPPPVRRAGQFRAGAGHGPRRPDGSGRRVFCPHGDKDAALRRGGGLLQSPQPLSRLFRLRRRGRSLRGPLPAPHRPARRGRGGGRRSALSHGRHALSHAGTAPAGGTFERRALGAWRGTTDTGTDTITLARADAENGAVVALLWGEKVEMQPLPFDIEVFIIDTTLQNDSAPSGTE